MPGILNARHIFFAKKLAKNLEIQKILLYLCDIKMISSLTFLKIDYYEQELHLFWLETKWFSGAVN